MAAAADGKVTKSNDEWKKVLSDQQFYVLRQAGTERAFTGPYWDDHEPGIYRCAGCGAEFFRPTRSPNLGSGWPSFTASSRSRTGVKTETDESQGMFRTEVRCAKCGGHLGHVFDNEPATTGAAVLHQRDCAQEDRGLKPARV